MLRICELNVTRSTRAANHLNQQFGLTSVKCQITQLIDYQQIEFAQRPFKFGQSVLLKRLGKLRCQRARSIEPHFKTGAASVYSKCCRKMSLAAAGISDHYHVLPFAYEIAGRQLSDTAFADVFQPMRVKFIKRFYCRKFRSFMRFSCALYCRSSSSVFISFSKKTA